MDHPSLNFRAGAARRRASRRLAHCASVSAFALVVSVASAPPALAGEPRDTPPTAGAGAAVELGEELRAEFDQQRETSFLVLMDAQADLSGAAAIDDWAARGEYVRDALTATAERSQAGLRSALAERNAVYQPYWIVNAVQVTGDVDLAEELALRPEVDRIVTDQEFALVEPMEVEAAPADGGVEWGVAHIQAPRVWEEHDARGDGIVVGVIDTGARYTHEALVRQYRGNLGDGEFDHNYHWHDPSNVCGTPSRAPCDRDGHGTHVTGTVLGDDGAANQIGVAPAAQWIAAVGCESRSCSTSALLSSGEFMLAPTDLAGENPRPELRPHVVNNSWGSDRLDDPWYRGIVAAWVAAGIFPQFAVGNTPGGAACASASNPGNLPESYAAGSFDRTGAVAATSQRGPSAWGDGDLVKPNIAAPGVQIRSAHHHGGYATASGTSMASPHVAGAVALLWSAAPELVGEVATTRELLDLGAHEVEDLTCGGTAGANNVYGSGRLDVYAAVTQVPGPGGGPEIVVDPDELTSAQGPDEMVTHELTIGNVGDDDLDWQVGAERARAGQVTLTHSESFDVVDGNSVACSPDGGFTTNLNGYLRAFSLPEFDVSSGFEVSEVSFGVESVREGPHEVTVNLFEMVDASGPVEYGNFELVGSAVQALESQELSVVSVPVAGEVSAGSTLVVEVDAPDLSDEGAFFIGSNSVGQSGPSYLRSEDCGMPEPVDVASIGFPEMQIVMAVTGSAQQEGPSCEVPSWLGVSPERGMVSPGGQQVVEVSFDSAGLSVGDEVSGVLCVASDDPGSPVVEVPVSLVVEEVSAPVVEVSPDAVAAEVEVGELVVESLSVGNTGDAPLHWDITTVTGEAADRLARWEEGVLLVPDSAHGRVMAFDPTTGDLIDPDFIGSDPAAELGVPIQLLLDPAGGDRWWLSDQLRGVVDTYDLAGQWQGVALPPGGPDPQLLANVRGLAASPTGTLLVTVAGGGNAHAVAEFDLDGTYLGNHVDNGAGGLNGPWAVLLRDDDMLVSASGSNAIHRYEPDGTPAGVFHDGIRFPQQMQQLPDGNLLVAQFSGVGESGVWELTADGELVDVYSGVTGNRGVFALPNGHILTTNSSGVHEIDRDGGLVETKIDGVDARFITPVQRAAPACDTPADVPWLSVDPGSGVTQPGEVAEVVVSLDAAGLEPGGYEALLCVSSDDPVTPVVEVPVSVEVSEASEPPPGPGPVCDVTISGVHDGPLTVAEGTTCLAAGAHVLGEVNVAEGAGLVGSAAVIQGPVSAVGADRVVLEFSQVTGPVMVSGATGEVSLFANSVTGGLSLSQNVAQAAPVVSGNTVIGVLSCSGNDPAPTDQGLSNTATAGKLGQCAEL